MAAVLAYGPGAVLSHRPGGAHWQLVSDRGPCEVAVPQARRSRPGIRVHQARLPADEITVHEGIPVTTVPRTLFDLAGVLPERQLERAINEAEVLHLWDELSLEHLLHRYPRHRGSRAVRTALHRRRQGSTATRSELEELFLALTDDAGIRAPRSTCWSRASRSMPCGAMFGWWSSWMGATPTARPPRSSETRARSRSPGRRLAAGAHHLPPDARYAAGGDR
jgi:hypothetical protein